MYVTLIYGPFHGLCIVQICLYEPTYITGMRNIYAICLFRLYVCVSVNFFLSKILRNH